MVYVWSGSVNALINAAKDVDPYLGVTIAPCPFAVVGRLASKPTRRAEVDKRAILNFFLQNLTDQFIKKERICVKV